MKIKTNAIVNSTGDGAVQFSNGLDVAGIVTSFNTNFTGITTTTSISCNTVSVTSANATLVGSGVSLTGLSDVTSGRIVGLKFILADPPLRA